MNSHDTDLSWGALAVAVLFEYPISVEEAIELFESGSIIIDGKKHKARTVIKALKIMQLRERGCAWWAISELTGIQSPIAYVSHRQEILLEAKRRENGLYRVKIKEEQT